MSYKEKQKKVREYIPTKTELSNETILTINNKVDGIKFDILHYEVFPFTVGEKDALNQYLKGVLIQLCDDNIIRHETCDERDTYHMNKMKKVDYYYITGKGIKLCDTKLFKNRPYSYFKAISFFERIFTKYLPIGISLTALIISYLGFMHKK